MRLCSKGSFDGSHREPPSNSQMEDLKRLIKDKSALEGWTYDGTYYRRDGWLSVKVKAPKRVVKAIKKTAKLTKYLTSFKLPSRHWYSDGEFFYRIGARYKYDTLPAVKKEAQNIKVAKKHIKELRTHMEDVHNVMRSLIWRLKGSVELTFRDWDDNENGKDVKKTREEEETGEAPPPPPPLPMPSAEFLLPPRRNPRRISTFTVDLSLDSDDEAEEEKDEPQHNHLDNQKRYPEKDPEEIVKKITTFISEVTGLNKVPGAEACQYTSLMTEFWVAVAVSHVLYDLRRFVKKYKRRHGSMYLVDDDAHERDTGQDLEMRLTLVRQVREGSRTNEALVETMSPETYEFLIRNRNNPNGSLEGPVRAEVLRIVNIAAKDEDESFVEEDESDSEDSDSDSDSEDDDKNDKEIRKVIRSVAFAKKIVKLWTDVKEDAEKKRLPTPDEAVFMEFMDVVATKGKRIGDFRKKLEEKGENVWWVKVVLLGLLKNR